MYYEIESVFLSGGWTALFAAGRVIIARRWRIPNLEMSQDAIRLKKCCRPKYTNRRLTQEGSVRLNPNQLAVMLVAVVMLMTVSLRFIVVMVIIHIGDISRNQVPGGFNVCESFRM